MKNINAKVKEKQNNATEDIILNAALDEIQEKTISGLRIRKVAEKAHIFQSNVHYYYSSKKELLLAVQRKVLSRYREIRQHSFSIRKTNTPITLEEHLDIFIQQKIQTIIKEPQYDVAELDFWNQSRLDPDMHQEFCRSFEHWRKDIGEMINRYAPKMPVTKQQLLSGITVSLLEGAAVQYLVDEKAFDIDSYFVYCKEILLKEIKG